MIFPLFYFSVFVLLNQYHFIFTILIVGLIALSIVYTLLMFTTQVTSKEIATEDIDHLLYRDTVRVQQTSIKLKNGKYRNVIFETTAARNTFVHFMREESFEVMALDRWLPLLPLNY
jgi:Ca2+/Na+ antiporter